MTMNQKSITFSPNLREEWMLMLTGSFFTAIVTTKKQPEIT